MPTRSYATGRTHTFTARGAVTLRFCGGTFVSGGNASGYHGADFFRPLTDSVGALVGQGQRHSVMARAWHGVGIRTYLDDAGPWRTDVLGGLVSPEDVGEMITGGEVIETWEDDDAPGVVTAAFVSSFTAAEWAYEDDAGSLRPGPYTPALKLGWVPSGSVSTVISGTASGTVTKPVSEVFGGSFDADFGQIVLWDKDTTFSYSAYAQFNQWYKPGLYNMYPLTATDGINKSGLPWPDANYASASGFSIDGTLPFWHVRRFENNGTAPPDQFPPSVTGWEFKSHDSSLGYTDLAGTYGWDTAVNGVVRDWNGSLYNIPLTFSGGPERLFTANRVIPEQPEEILIHPPAGFSPTDTACALIRYGASWTALTLDRSASLVVDDFSRLTGPNRWDATDLFSMNYSGGVLTIEGQATGDPRIEKALKSDFNDMTSDFLGPEHWWYLHASTFPTEAQDWWEATGPAISIGSEGHVGDWWKVGRRMLPDSDVFNWSSYRYLDLTAGADAACTVTLTVDYDEIDFAEDFSFGYSVTLTRTARTVAYPVEIGTAAAARRIDLPSRAGHDGLRYLRRLKIQIPVSRTVSLSGLTLAERARPVVDVHLPTDDHALLTAREDGKHCLFLSPRTPIDPGSLWGWPSLRRVSPGGTAPGAYQSMLAWELAAELNLQEGWHATPGGAPDHGTPSYVTFLREQFGRPCPAALSARRGFARARVYAHYAAYGPALDLEANLGSAIHPLTFDPDTFVPVAVPIEADSPAGATLDGAVTDAQGAGRLEVHEEDLVTVVAGRGTTDSSSAGDTLANRTLYFPRLTAKAIEGGSGPLVLDIDRNGSAWLTHVKDSQVMVERRLSAWAGPEQAEWDPRPIGAVGSDPWIHVDETSREMKVNVVFRWGTDTLYQVSSGANGTGDWKMVSIGTGGHPFLRKDKATGLTYYLYWRGDKVYLKRSADDGQTFIGGEIEVLSSAVEATYTLDFRLDPAHTIEMPYSDGTDIKSRISTDNGLTWGDAP